MRQYFESHTLKTTAGTDIINITEMAGEFITKSGIKNGLFTASVPGSTASISTIEYEGGVLEDLKEVIESLVPSNHPYAHDSRWGDGNGYAHVRSALMKTSLSVPLEKGNLLLGTWQQLILMDFDNRPRSRKVLFHVIGE